MDDKALAFKTLIDVINDYVQEMAQSIWENDSCPPKYIVSKDDRNSILITITHLGQSYTTCLFPTSDYEDVSVYYVMEQLYNRTM